MKKRAPPTPQLTTPSYVRHPPVGDVFLPREDVTRPLKLSAFFEYSCPAVWQLLPSTHPPVSRLNESAPYFYGKQPL